MTKSQIDQYDMVLSTEKCLIENEALYADNVPLMDRANALKNE